MIDLSYLSRIAGPDFSLEVKRIPTDAVSGEATRAVNIYWKPARFIMKEQIDGRENIYDRKRKIPRKRT
jgi:hypothetical protein